MSHDERATSSASEAVVAWLQALAAQARRDPTFAAQLLATLRASDLADALSDATLPAVTSPSPQRATRHRGAPRTSASTSASTSADSGDTATAAPDPFSVYRAQGEQRLRATLEALDLPTLRVIVRSHRLDPARISARWTTRERVIGLIVDQVKARANHGRAFERI